MLDASSLEELKQMADEPKPVEQPKTVEKAEPAHQPKKESSFERWARIAAKIDRFCGLDGMEPKR